jgi:2-polyprenyl-6-methoxyphenol hydroxylase-like FAD-dependent oxidoreductase
MVIDRDRLTDDGAPRRGVPQGNHGHVLLVAGQRALAELFPGVEDDLHRAGATSFDIGADLSTYRFGTVWPPLPTGFRLISLSRPRLELVLRQRIAALPNVVIRDEVAVSGLTGTDGRVAGVVLDDGETVPADLVVDCSGRGGRSDRWLDALGYPAPAVVEVKVGVCYSTRLFRRGPGDLAAGQGIFVLPTPPAEKRIGLVLPIEDDRWLVSLGGWHTPHPPGDPDEFRADAAALPHSAIAELISGAEPLTDVTTFRFPSSRRRRFEQLRILPAGYVAVGDAICSFNPVYGQGMTCAALEALALRSTLERHGGATTEMAREFYRAAALVIVTPWRFAVGGDFAYPETTGPRPFAIDLLNRYSRQVQLASLGSAEIRRTFMSVQHLVAPPKVLFRPLTVAKVLLAARHAPAPAPVTAPVRWGESESR